MEPTVEFSRSMAMKCNQMYIIFSEDLRKALAEFSNIANKQNYKGSRIPYGNWRKLTKYANPLKYEYIDWWISPEDIVYFYIDSTEYTAFKIFPEFLEIIERYLKPPMTTLDSNTLYITADRISSGISSTVGVIKDTSSAVDELTKRVNKLEKESKTMHMPAMNFEYGPVDSSLISLSPYGLAIKDTKGAAYAYNAATKQTVDVSGFTFDFKGMIYKMPVAVNQVAVGDMILHKGKAMFVYDINGTEIHAVDILRSEAKTVIPVTNMFGFNFVTKVFSMVNLDGSTPSADQPFGNLMPIMMASMVFGEGETPWGGTGDSMDFGKMMMLSAMMGGKNPFANMFNFGQNNNQEG